MAGREHSVRGERHINFRQTVIESGPSATTIEFRSALIQRSAAASTGVDTFFVMLVVFTCACHFGTLLAKNAELGRCLCGLPKEGGPI
jgi:hypothetical protein